MSKVGSKTKKIYVKKRIPKFVKLRNNEVFKKARFSKANLTIFSIIFAAIGGYFIYSSFAATTNCSSVSQNGITINFNKAYICGTFANGDPWVVPNAGDTGVVVSSMSPAFSGGQNGWEVNPNYTGGQGFDIDIDDYDASLVPSLPYTATGNKSIVKATSAGTSCPNNVGCLQTAIVLTVLSAVPPNDGANIFRPPYVGTTKPLYTTTQLQTQLLPSLSISGYTPPSLSSVAGNIHKLQLDHQDGLKNRNMHPIDNMPDYGSSIAVEINDAVGRLMFNDSVSAKMPLLIDTVQGGIDRYYMTLQGQLWTAPGPGHNMGRKLSIAFAATMLGDATMKNNIQTQTAFANFHEDAGQIVGKNGIPLFGGFADAPSTESYYWSYIAGSDNNIENADPYGYIDGGTHNGGLNSYQICCTIQPWKGSALALHLMPSMETIWQNHAKLETYVIRMVTKGAHYQPDPCAPVSQGGGPLPGDESPIQCKLDPDLTTGSTFTSFSCQAGKQCGRFPDLEGAEPDGGFYRSDIIDHLWAAYGDTTVPPPPPPPAPDPTPPTVSMVSPTNGATISGPTVTLSANASDNVGVIGVQFKVDGTNAGTEDTSSPYSISWDSFTVANGIHTITATARDAAGNSTTSSSVSVTVSNTGNITIGTTTVGSADDNGNANLLLAQQTTLSQTATIQSMSFYVTVAAGKLRLGIYDATGSGGGPGAKKAETAEFTPVVGWNTAGVTTPVSLPAGTYWLAYAPSDNNLGFRIDRSGGTHKYATQIYGIMPTSFPATNTTATGLWSFYATLSLGGTTPPPPPPAPKVGDINNDNSVNITDLSLLLSSYGQSTTQCITNTSFKCDLSTPGDGVVNIFDLSILLSKYGT